MITLSTQKQLLEDGWKVTISFQDKGELPSEHVFVYTNTGTTTLGTFYGTASFSDLTRMQKWTGTAIPVFGNKFVLHDEVVIYPVLNDENPDTVITKIINGLTKLRLEVLSLNQTVNTVTIP